jgi:hypothetical protein
MKAHLSTVCSIYTGYTARGRLETIEHGGVRAIQLRDLSPQGRLGSDSLARVDVGGFIDRYFVGPGDVLFRSRGERTTAFALDEHFGESALAVLPLMILRPIPGIVTAQYLAWAINQPTAQRQLDAASRGTNMRMVPRAGLEQLEICIPDIQTQQKIVAIDTLSERERTLSFLASERRRELTSHILSERAKSLSHLAGNERNAE